MTSRERLAATLNHQPTDRLCVDFGAGFQTGMGTGAVHRLRPKLMTEGVAIIGLMPMLWATGVGAEVIKPMAAPVLGGLLVADEVIDLLIPVVFNWYQGRRWRKLHGADGPTAEPVAVGRAT